MLAAGHRHPRCLFCQRHATYIRRDRRTSSGWSGPRQRTTTMTNGEQGVSGNLPFARAIRSGIADLKLGQTRRPPVPRFSSPITILPRSLVCYTYPGDRDPGSSLRDKRSQKKGTIVILGFRFSFLANKTRQQLHA